jgi:hypothetical protein
MLLDVSTQLFIDGAVIAGVNANGLQAADADHNVVQTLGFTQHYPAGSQVGPALVSITKTTTADGIALTLRFDEDVAVATGGQIVVYAPDGRRVDLTADCTPTDAVVELRSTRATATSPT